MKTDEKLELLKDTIYHLYSKEGRSKSYISELLNVNRKKLTSKIKEWGFPEAEPRRHMTASTKKLLHKHKNTILARLRNGYSIEDISKEINVSRYVISKTFRDNDENIRDALEEHERHIHRTHQEAQDALIEQSSREYITEFDPKEEWKPILGWDGYHVSNKGRIKAFAERYGTYFLIKQFPNANNGRPYVMLTSGGTRKNLQVARLVAYAFVNGHSEKRNTVNHKDGNVQNNNADNLEWCSQGENNKHSYDELDRSKVNSRRYKFTKLIYKDKYEFKTVAALARFLGKSETQTRRYLDEPDKHDIKLVE